MQGAERWDDPETRRPSRRNSASLQDRASSASSTPKRTPRNPHPDFMITGKQIAKRSGRTNSIPGALPRRGAGGGKGGAASGAASGAAGGAARGPHSAPARARPADYDATLDLSLVSDFEDTSSKYGCQHRFSPLAASSPKRKPQPHQPQPHQPQPHQPQPHRPRGHRSLDSRQSTLAGSRDSSFMSSSSYRPGPEGTDPEYTPGSAEYSAPSSAGSATEVPGTLVSPRSQDCLSSYCVSWQECERDLPCAGVPGGPPGPCCRCGGEWGHFWEDYNRARARGPVRRYYDQCPTPYRSEDFDPADLEVSAEGPPRSPEDITLNTSREGLRLTGRETRELVRCARFLGDVLSRAAGRAGCGPAVADQLTEIKKTMTLPLKETTIPVERRWETATTQTDISLPNTKSAPRIFEKILRQLSKTSLEVPDKEKEEKEKKEEDREEKEEKEESREISKGT